MDHFREFLWGRWAPSKAPACCGPWNSWSDLGDDDTEPDVWNLGTNVGREQFLHFYLHFSPLPFVERFFSRRFYLSFDLKCKWFLFRWQLAPAGICFVGVACCSKDPQSLIFSECVYDSFIMIQIPRISISVMFGDILFYVYIVAYIHFRCRFLRIALLLPWLSGSETESFSIVRKRR